MSCRACGTENPPGFRFCGSCGASLLGSPCPSCGTLNLPEQKFCGDCGTQLVAVPLAPAVEERKLATVLFADVVGFTSLAESMDHELVARTVDGAFRRLGEVVEEHGGTVDKYMGDSVMAVFGVPVAHDDDAERAVAAGLAMREIGGDLAFSIGINSGDVMVTAVGRAGDVTVIGDTVNVAARLEKAAGPGEVLVGRLTAELAGRSVAFSERQPVLLKGKREPVPVFEAVALRRLGTGRGADHGPSLVGREDDLAFLVAQWRRVRRDESSGVVLLCGEAGVGKTRLLDELSAAVDGCSKVVRTTYPAYGGLGGPRVAADIISQVGLTGDTEVDARVRSLAGDLHPSLQTIDATAMEQEQLWAFRKLLHAKAADEPLVIAIDDIHRAGDKSLQMLSELMLRVPDAAVLLVLAGRPDPSEWLTRFPVATTVRLGPLSRGDAVALAAAFVRSDAPLSSDAARFLVDRSGGNPLYLRELVTVLQTRDALVERDGEVHLVGSAPVPATLQAVLAARIDALTPSQKLAVQHVAVLGDAATEEQVMALGLTDVTGVLSSLVDCGLLRHSPDGGYDLVDPLLREVAYETVPRHVRGERHRRAADIVVSREGRARHLDRAVSFLPDDADLADQAAAALSRAGIELLDAARVGDGARLLQRAIDLGQREPKVLLRLAEANAAVGRPGDVERVLDLIPADCQDPYVIAARAHARAANRLWAEPEPARVELLAVAERWHELGVLEKEAWAYANAAVAAFNVSAMHESVQDLERAIALFRQAGDRSGELSAYSFLSLARPDDPRIPAWLAEGLAYWEAQGDRSRQLSALLSLSWYHYFRARVGSAGTMAEARRTAQRLLGLAKDLGGGDMVTHGAALSANLARLAGDLAEAQRILAGVPAHDFDHGPAKNALVNAVAFGVDVASSSPDRALTRPVGDLRDPVFAVAALLEVEALALAGRADEAAARLGQLGGLPDLGQTGRLLGGYVAGLVSILTGRPEEAEQLLRPSVGAAETIGGEPSALAGRALLAEVTGELDGLPSVDGPPDSIALALVARARAVHGDVSALSDLGKAAAELAAPGLLRGLI